MGTNSSNEHSFPPIAHNIVAHFEIFSSLKNLKQKYLENRLVTAILLCRYLITLNRVKPPLYSEWYVYYIWNARTRSH